MRYQDLVEKKYVAIHKGYAADLSFVAAVVVVVVAAAAAAAAVVEVPKG